MNFSISNQAISNTWKHSKLQYVTLAAGLSLAISAGLGLSGSLKGETGTTVSPRSSSTISIGRPDRRPVVFYIVDNEEQAHAIQSAVSTESAAYEAVSRSDYRTIVVQNEQQRYGLGEAMRETGSNAQFIDLREGAFKLQPVYSQASVRSSANESAEEYAAREAAELRLLVPSVNEVRPAFVESPEVTAAGEAWQYGSSSIAAPAPAVIVESAGTIAAGEAWQYGVR